MNQQTCKHPEVEPIGTCDGFVVWRCTRCDLRGEIV